jgi:nitroreductase
MTSPLNESTLKQLFLDARTVHGFLPEPISAEQIHAIYDLMKWAPTSFNGQHARFVFLKSDEAKARLMPALTPGNVPQVQSAAVTVIVAYDTKFFENFATQFTASNPATFYENNAPLADATAFRNGSLQGAYLIMAVRALGWDCGAMSGFDLGKVNAEFFADGRFKANFLLNIGRADPAGIWPRGPRLAFDQVAQII